MLRVFFGILTLTSLALTAWRWVLHWRFPLHQRNPMPPSLPGVTFLKPLKGCDPETKACLRSWFQQTYPGPVQILLGVATADDPVCAVAMELIAEFSNVDAQCVICPESLGANPKVSTLRQLERSIKHPLVMISDADTRVPADLAASVTPLCREGVGLVNCFYRLANPATVAMRWEAVAMNADFWTHVLQASSIGKSNFALGAVMTLPMQELKAIGGFAALADYLADDYQLGDRIAARGRRVELAAVVVDCWDPPAGWATVWRHQLRWGRTIRVCQPAPFFFSIVNNSSVWPLLLLLASLHGPFWAVVLGCGALVFRVGTALQQQTRMTQKRAHWAYWWMIPVKDILDATVWALAFWDGAIEWRGGRYHIGAGGRLEPA